LPEYLGGYPVTAVASFAFSNVTSITSVVFPSGLSSIGQAAFSGCSGLQSVSFPETLTDIGISAFNGCSSLAAVSLPNDILSLNNYLFKNCTQLGSVTLPASLESIGQYAFQNCLSLQNVTLPQTLQSIGMFAFEKCSALQSIAIPDSVTLIGQNAFEGCTALGTLTLSENLSKIEYETFKGCTALTSVTFPENLTEIGWASFSGCTNLSSITLNAGLKKIYTAAFSFCNKLRIVAIPDTVTMIDNRAFWYCNGLLSVTIPHNTLNFGSDGDSFQYCTNLTIYCTPGSVAAYAQDHSIPYVFITPVTVQFNANGGSPNMTVTQNCGTALTAPVVTRTGYTFTGWQPAVPAVMPTANTTYTAQWTVNQYTITFDANGGTGGWTKQKTYGDTLTPPVVTKDLYLFSAWIPAPPATVPASNATYTAQWTPIYTYTVTGGTVTITGCSTLVTGALTIPSALDGFPVTAIAYQAFKDCTGITALTIPSSVTWIDSRAFMGCTGLTAVTIPASVTSIGNQAFQDCTALASVTLPDTLAQIGSGVFFNTAWLNAKPDGPVYAGKIFYRYKGTMPAGTTLTVAAGTLGIGGSAFSGFANLSGITLPESLTAIGASAFNGCSGLTTLIMPESVAVIGSNAFNNCAALTLGVFPESYAHTYANENSIPHAFVARITFDANGGTGGCVQTLFYGAPLTAPAVQKTSYVLGSWLPAVPAVVPEGNATYVAQWVTVFSYTVKDSVATVTGTNITVSGAQAIPAQLGGYPVKFIGEAAFRNMNLMTSMTIPDGVLSIAGGAFDGCSGLTSVTIPASVREIGTNAFHGCPNLVIYCYPDSYAIEYAETYHLQYRVRVTVTFHLNGGTGTVPAALNGLNGDAVALPAQGDITRDGYHFLGWAKSAAATAPLGSYAMETRDRTLYAVWSMIPALAARSGSTTVLNAQSGFIYGLATGLTKTAFESTFVSVAGNGRLQYAPDTGSIGTGTKVQVIDNITGLAVQTFTVVIFGDVNGDGNIDAGDAGIIVDYENFFVTWDPSADAALLKAADVNGDGNVDTGDAGIVVDHENFMLTISQATGLPV